MHLGILNRAIDVICLDLASMASVDDIFKVRPVSLVGIGIVVDSMAEFGCAEQAQA